MDHKERFTRSQCSPHQVATPGTHSGRTSYSVGTPCAGDSRTRGPAFKGVRGQKLKRDLRGLVSLQRIHGAARLSKISEQKEGLGFGVVKYFGAVHTNKSHNPYMKRQSLSFKVSPPGGGGH